MGFQDGFISFYSSSKVAYKEGCILHDLLCHVASHPVELIYLSILPLSSEALEVVLYYYHLKLESSSALPKRSTEQEEWGNQRG